MSQIISNSEVMKLFREADEIKADAQLTEAQKKDKVENIHNKIIKELSFLVYNGAKSYRKFPNYEDLVQEGFIGLLKAVRKFEHARFPNFFVYAEQWIRHRIKNSASRFDVVYNPNKQRVVYADDLGDSVEEETEFTPEDVYFEVEKKESIKKVLDEFPEREREIVKRIFGLDDHSPQTLREIGPDFDITYERIRQIKNNVISKLRKNQRLNDLC